MTTPTAPQLFDRALLSARRARARAHPRPGADFLLRRVVEDLDDRLAPRPPRLRRGRRSRPRRRPGGTAGEGARQGDEGHRGGARPRRRRRSGGRRGGPCPSRRRASTSSFSLLSLQFVDDLPGTLIQIRRALRPDGLFLAALLGGSTLHELRDALSTAEIELTGGLSPRVAPFIGVSDLGRLLQRAGFALPVTDTDRLTVRYGSMFDLVRRPQSDGGPPIRCGSGRAARRRAVSSCAPPRSMPNVTPTPTAGCAPLSRSSRPPAGPRTRASRSRRPAAAPRCRWPRPSRHGRSTTRTSDARGFANFRG